MAKLADCSMCQDPIYAEKGGRHPRKIADLNVSTAVLHPNWQFYKGSTILVFQDHVTELHHLTPELQHRFVDDASRIAAALEKTFSAIKLNHGLMGNAMPHLHWHMMVRRAADPEPKLTIWETDLPKVELSDEEFMKAAEEIRRNL